MFSQEPLLWTGRTLSSPTVHVVVFVVPVVAAAPSVTVSVPVSVEQHQADNIDGESDAPDDEHQVRVVDVLVVEHALQRLDEDGEAECDQEDCVYECAQHLGARPPECVALHVTWPLRDLQREFTDNFTDFCALRRFFARTAHLRQKNSPPHPSSLDIVADKFMKETLCFCRELSGIQKVYRFWHKINDELLP